MKQFVVPVQKDAGLEDTVELDNYIESSSSWTRVTMMMQVMSTVELLLSDRRLATLPSKFLNLSQKLLLNISADKLLFA